MNGLASAPDQPVVVGAGIVGVMIAFELQRRGMSPLLIDPCEPGRGASFGNMASIAVSEFQPVSRPAVLAQLPGWLLRPDGPVHISPTYFPRLTPWLIRFLAAGAPHRVRQIEAAGAALCRRAHDDLLPVLSDAGLSGMLSSNGCLSLYRNDVEFRADRAHIDALDRHGFEYRHLDRSALRACEPAISQEIQRAVLLPANRSISDPHALVTRIFQTFLSRGGRFQSGRLAGWDHDGRVLQVLRLHDGHRIETSSAILCAGAHTGRLARIFGDRIPMESERGYHNQVMTPGIRMNHSIIWPARAFMVTPTAGGIRIGGTVEMAGLDAPANFRRAKVLIARAREALPGLATNDVTEWMGHRPALPDTIPIIGPSTKAKGVWYATGHGHLGLTLAATTARLLGDMITSRKPPIDMTPYRADRF